MTVTSALSVRGGARSHCSESGAAIYVLGKIMACVQPSWDLKGDTTGKGPEGGRGSSKAQRDSRRRELRTRGATGGQGGRWKPPVLYPGDKSQRL